MYLAAADVYLDTFPFSSLTSLLEASAFALPVLMFDGHQGLRRALGVADYVGPAEDRPTDTAAYQRRLTALAKDAQARQLSGFAARDTYRSLTPDSTWIDCVEALYRTMAEIGRDDPFLGDTPPVVSEDQLVDYALAILAVEHRTPLLWTVMGHVTEFSGIERHELYLRGLIARGGRKAASLLGLPPWLSDHLLVPPARRKFHPSDPGDRSE